MALHISTPIVKMLQDRGLLPKHCAKVELHIPPHGAMVLRFDVFVSDESAEILGEAFTAMAAEDRAKHQ